jgi:nitrite reductase/ring-hydroxylating ferredoxin subunit
MDLGPAHDVLANGRAVVAVGTRKVEVLIVRTRKGIFAIDNRCPHAGHPLEKGAARRTSIRCPAHGREYDMTSGLCRTRPRSRPLIIYPVWLDNDGHVRLAVPAEED